MATTPYLVERFGGLNVVDDPEEVGVNAAVDLLNVSFDLPGRVRTRDGSSVVSSTASGSALIGGTYYKTSAGTEYLVAVDSSTITPYALATGTAGTTRSATIVGGNNGFARFGDTTNTLLYTGEATTSNVQRFDGTTWSNVAAPLAPAYLAVTGTDNRLAIAGAGSLAQISFSGAGAPETFGANDFVYLTPGDGEPVTGLASWREMLFAFKQTKFYVFGATSTDSDGQPIFNYRPVTAGQGCSPGAVTVGDDGVYFANRSGVYVTTGDVPRYLSRQLEPWVRAGALGSLPSLSLTSATLAYLDRKLYVNDQTNRTTLVYDTVLESWTVWQLGASFVTSVPASSATYTSVYFGENASKKVWKVDRTATADNGSAISWRYGSGAVDLSGKSQAAVTLESRLWGSGTVTLKVANDHGSFDTGSALTLGTSPAIADAWQQIDREGVFWQHQLSGSGQAVVNRLAHMVSFVKPAGVA
jgi:hypothetical protein